MKIPKNIYEDLFRHALEDTPVEACGYLAGKDGQVEKHYRMTNTDQSKEHFALDPKEQFHVLKTTRADGLEIIGVYHSHPETPARPSKEDIRLASDPLISYVIVSLAENKKAIKSFKINKGQVTADPLEIF